MLRCVCKNFAVFLLLFTNFQGDGGGGALNSLRNFRLQKKKFSAGTFDSDASSAEPSQSQGSTGGGNDTTDTSDNVTAAGDVSDDSPVKPVGGKRFFDESPKTEQSQVLRFSAIIYSVKNNMGTTIFWSV